MEVSLYSGSAGINNKTAPHRLPAGSALEQAMDVLIDQSGEIVSRKGSTLLEAGTFHSLYPCDGGFYVIGDRTDDSVIYRAVIGTGGLISSLNAIWAGLIKGQPMSYFTMAGEVYYSNRYQRGKLQADIRTDWPASEWTGQNSNKDIIVLPHGEHIEMLSSVCISSVGDELFFTPPGLLGIYDGVRGRRRMEADVTMLCAVSGGLYVSTEDAVYFLSGLDPITWTVKKVLDYPAYGKNQNLVDPSFFGLETTQLSGLFSTVNGPVIGLPDGTCINLIDKNVKTAGCKKGNILVVDETMVLT